MLTVAHVARSLGLAAIGCATVAAPQANARDGLPRAGVSAGKPSMAQCRRDLRRKLIGSWTLTAGEGLVPEMQFKSTPRRAPIFRSWQEMRPGLWGHYRIDGCRVTIIDQGKDNRPVRFEVIDIKTQKMRLRFEDYAESGTYKRIGS